MENIKEIFIVEGAQIFCLTYLMMLSNKISANQGENTPWKILIPCLNRGYFKLIL